MKKAGTLFLFLTLGFLGGIFSLHLFSFKYIEKYLISGEGVDLIPIEIIEKREITVRENEALLEKIEKVEKAVVAIKTGNIEGSGLIVSSDGLLVTWSSIIPINNNFEFYINGDKASYQVLRRDIKSGLALIKLNETGLTALEFGDSERLKIGERVFLVGAVFNESKEIQKSANEGVVKRVDKYIKTNIIEENKLSGSALFNIEGKVLGLNLVDQKGVVYALPISEIQKFVGF
jgi:S1-C subfamily serine protease